MAIPPTVRWLLGILVLLSLRVDTERHWRFVQTQLSGSTICILWHAGYDDFQPRSVASAYASFVSIGQQATWADSFSRDVIDASAKANYLRANDLPFDELLLRLTLAIEASHCESFLVFGADIPVFVAAFSQAAMYSIWRSTNNKFVFAHVAGELADSCCQDYFFQDQPNIMFVVRSYANATTFDLLTNKYVGPRAEQPAQLLHLDRYDALTRRFQLGAQLFPDKLRDLQGREVIVAGFDYRPYTVVKYQLAKSNARDVGVPADSELADVYIDGTETRVVLTFCERFNCTVQIDTSDASDWGTIYTNMSGDGALSEIINHKADICIGAMYSWHHDYIYLDMSMFLVRSGITCVVPAPGRLTSWFLPLQPFQATLWAAVFLCLTIETVGLVVAHKSERILYVGPGDSWWHSTMYALTTTFKLFISQSGANNVRSMTVRVLLFACFLNDMIITSIYGGGLASILTIPSLAEAADTLSRLRSHRLKWAGNSEAWVSAIRNSEEPLVQDLLRNYNIYSDEELFKLAPLASMGFTLERLPFGHFAIGDYLTSEAIEKMVIMQDDIYFQYTVAFVPRLWALLERFNTLIYQWHSSGFDKYWEDRVVADNLNVQKQQQVESTMTGSRVDNGPVSLAMSNFMGILLVWMLGITVSAIVFAAELLLGACQLAN